jgi:hypothetical protein
MLSLAVLVAVPVAVPAVLVVVRVPAPAGRDLPVVGRGMMAGKLLPVAVAAVREKTAARMAVEKAATGYRAA